MKDRLANYIQENEVIYLFVCSILLNKRKNSHHPELKYCSSYDYLLQQLKWKTHIFSDFSIHVFTIFSLYSNFSSQISIFLNGLYMFSTYSYVPIFLHFFFILRIFIFYVDQCNKFPIIFPPSFPQYRQNFLAHCFLVFSTLMKKY